MAPAFERLLFEVMLMIVHFKLKQETWLTVGLIINTSQTETKGAKKHLDTKVWPPKYWSYDRWNSYFIYSDVHDQQDGLYSSKCFSFSSSNEMRRFNVLESETRENLGSLRRPYAIMWYYYWIITQKLYSIIASICKIPF